MAKEKNPKKVPAGALCLGFEGPTALAEFAGQDGNKTPQMNMVIYSGGVIKDHWWWDNLLLDLEGMSCPKKKFPILENHRRDLKIAFHDGPPVVDKDLRVNPDKVKFVSTKESEQFQTLSSEGFPYEASARVKPTVIERVSEGAFAEANGIKLKGPGTIFRKWEFVEGSVCVFGYDRNTESTSFAEEVELDCEFLGAEANLNFNQNAGAKIMDLDTLQKEHPDLYEKIRKDAFAEAASAEGGREADFNGKIQEISGTVTQLQGTVQQQEQTIEDLKKQNLSLERENTLRTEAEMKAKAGSIWTAKLSQSEVPEHMHEKIQKHVVHSQFIEKESGNCNWEQFSEGVDNEIKSWEADLTKFSSSVRGGGYNSHAGEEGGSESETELQAEDAWVNEMVGLAQDDGGAE